MFSASFIFEPHEYDDEFHELNSKIDDLARSSPGFAGSESWLSADGARRNAVYYWESLDALEAFSKDPAHLEAKRRYAKWYKGYHVVIAEVLKTYGDGGVEHITPDTRRSQREEVRNKL